MERRPGPRSFYVSRVSLASGIRHWGNAELSEFLVPGACLAMLIVPMRLDRPIVHWDAEQFRPPDDFQAMPCTRNAWFRFFVRRRRQYSTERVGFNGLYPYAPFSCARAHLHRNGLNRHQINMLGAVGRHDRRSLFLRRPVGSVPRPEHLWRQTSVPGTPGAPTCDAFL